jgi:hypothetical protein
MSKEKLVIFPWLESTYCEKGIFPLTLVLRAISNRDNSELSHIAHRELYKNSLFVE